MGTELALHLLDHDLTVWNRTPEKAQRLIDAGARFGKDTSNADVVITSLFGPDTVREILPDIGDALWIDTTTVSPTDAATPVVGTLGPARAGKLGVYVGEPRAAEAAGIVRPWADPERLKIVETAAPSSHRKTPRQPRTRRQCSRPPRSPRPRTCSRVRVRRHPLHARLHWASLHQKHESPPFILGERGTTPGDFSADAIAKDVRLMLDTADKDLPAARAALASLEDKQRAGHGDEDFSVIFQ